MAELTVAATPLPGLTELQGLVIAHGADAQVLDSTALDVVENITLDTAAVLEGSDPNSCGLITAGGLTVTSSGEDGGQVLLSGTMSAVISGMTQIDTTPCQSGRGCTPPVLHIAASASLESDLLDVTTGGIVQAEENATLTILGDALLSNDGREGGQMILTGETLTHVASDATLSYVPCGGAPGRGCTPPILHMEQSAHLVLEGGLNVLGDADVQIGALATVALAGDFVNQNTNSSLFDWGGSLKLDGATTQTFEVAGADMGADPDGLVNNFALGQLEVATGAHAQFVDVFDNDLLPQGPCGEALYLETLVLRSGCTLELVNCRVYWRRLLDEGGSVVLTGCSELVRVPIPGDLNCDGSVNFGDINPFVLYLSNYSLWLQTYAGCLPTNGDINRDGTYPSFGDINPFVALLTK